MNRIKIFLVVVFFASIQMYGQYSGRVISKDGTPLSGVHICSTTWRCSLSDSDGSFSHSLDGGKTDVLNFSLDGFIPRTVIVPPNKNNMEIILKPGEAGTWRIPTCTDKKSYIKFGRFWIKIPKKTKINKFQDIDYAGSNIRYSDKEFMRYGSGVNWSRGFPRAKRIQESKQLTERILVLPDHYTYLETPSISGVDVRGVYEDGSYWRYTGNFFWTFDYDHVSKEAAEFFDSSLDTLCVMK